MQYEHDQLVGAVKEYIAVMKESGLEYLKVKNDKFELEIGEKRPPMPPLPFAPPVQAQLTPSAAPVQTAAPQVLKPCGNIVKSPIIGTFYSAAAPGKPPFAAVGAKVTKGQTICIVESMKLMNEITSEFNGTVAEIYVNDGQAVEFDQPLMRIE